mmetsp:Transcript_77078/g.193868  ORF Transcript_77078/g.193868 Transcript_77078/m.193868 type:complete len:102 (-) Transcript_77078:1014-1319(-)
MPCVLITPIGYFTSGSIEPLPRGWSQNTLHDCDCLRSFLFFTTWIRFESFTTWSSPLSSPPRLFLASQHLERSWRLSRYPQPSLRRRGHLEQRRQRYYHRY